MADWILLNFPSGGGDLGEGATSGTFKQLGISQPMRFLTNGGRDRFTFMADGRNHDLEPLVAFGNRVSIVHPNGTTWFQGTITTLPRFASGDSEGHSYEIQGPIYALEQNVYKLVWPGVSQVLYTSHLILHYGSNQTIETTRVTIGRILDYVLSLYPAQTAPFQYMMSDILPGTSVQPPLDEVRDILCSEALRRCIQWHPRSVLWFDYSTSPPTLKIAPRGTLTSASFAGGNALPAAKCVSLNLSPRYDLIRPSVAITFETESETNGDVHRTFTREIAPAGATGLEVGCRNMSLDLRGAVVNSVSAYIETTPIDINDIEWWKSHLPALKHSTIYKNLAIKAGTPFRMGSREQGIEIASLNLPFEVTSRGQFPGWIKDTGIQVQRERARCVITYDVMANDGITILDHGEQLFSVSITATDAVTKTYAATTDAVSGDPHPVGLAQFLYDEVKDLQWDASFEFVDQEVLGTLAPGKFVNVTGSRTEFSSMNAVIQSVVEDIDKGKSTVSCGPMPGHEGPEILELIRVTRPRIRYTAIKTFDDGDVSEGVELGEETADENGVAAAARETLKTVRDEANGKKVTMDAGKGAAGVISPADPVIVKTAGAAHVSVRDGAKAASLNASDGQMILLGNAQISGIISHIPAGSHARFQQWAVCKVVGGNRVEGTAYFWSTDFVQGS